MKFQVTFKTPDAVKIALDDHPYLTPEDVDDADDWDEQNYLLCKKFAAKWVKYGEMVTIEFDTEKGTATVVMDQDLAEPTLDPETFDRVHALMLHAQRSGQLSSRDVSAVEAILRQRLNSEESK